MLPGIGFILLHARELNLHLVVQLRNVLVMMRAVRILAQFLANSLFDLGPIFGIRIDNLPLLFTQSKGAEPSARAGAEAAEGLPRPQCGFDLYRQLLILWVTDDQGKSHAESNFLRLPA